MIAILCIIAVVAAISLYDFYSTRAWQQVTSSERNDLVFERRNQEYGAYKIRRDYNKRLLLIISGLTVGIGGLYGASLGMRSLEYKEPTTTTEVWLPLPPIEEPEVLAVIPKPETQQPAGGPEMTEFPTYEPSDDDQGDIQIIEPGQVVGPVTQTGNGDPFAEPGFGDTGDSGVIVEEIPPSKPELYVDEPAEFIGGRPKMLEFIGENLRYPEIAVQNEWEGKCHLQFVVAKSGEISNVLVIPGRGVPNCKQCDTEAMRVINKMPRWKPGKKNGRVVDSYFNMPIVFTLQN